MDIIEVTNNFNNYVIPVVIGCIGGGLMLYLAITVNISTAYKAKLRKAERLIHEGHAKAVKGKKNDGIYKETRRLKEGAL